MSSPPLTIEESTAIEEAAYLTVRKEIQTLLVMDNEELAGFLTSTDTLSEVPSMLSVLRELCKSPSIIYNCYLENLI
jgi:predicted transcriptional regulator